MDVTKEELAVRFRGMSDDELLSRLEYDLTPLAREVVTAELQSRGVEAPPGNDGVANAGDDPAVLDPDDANVEVVTVATYWDVTQANLVCSCLQSCNVPAYVWGEGLGRANLFLAVAAGGLRVQVRSDQFEEAKEIIAALERGEMTAPDDPESGPGR